MFSFGDYRINLTRSAPLGLWQIGSMDRALRAGDRVFVCPPKNPAFDLAHERHYLPKGSCPSGIAPLIKTIVAMGGQSVAIDDHIVIDGQVLPSSKVLAHDPEGRSLIPWTGRVLLSDELFLFSDFAGSYDSRYVGPFPSTHVLGMAREVLTLRL